LIKLGVAECGCGETLEKHPLPYEEVQRSSLTQDAGRFPMNYLTDSYESDGE